MNVYDEAMSEEKRNAHRGVIQQLNRSVTRSAPKPAIPQVIDKVGVPDGTTLNRFTCDLNHLASCRTRLYAVCAVFESSLDSPNTRC